MEIDQVQFQNTGQPASAFPGPSMSGSSTATLTKSSLNDYGNLVGTTTGRRQRGGRACGELFEKQALTEKAKKHALLSTSPPPPDQPPHVSGRPGHGLHGARVGSHAAARSFGRRWWL